MHDASTLALLMVDWAGANGVLRSDVTAHTPRMATSINDIQDQATNENESLPPRGYASHIATLRRKGLTQQPKYIHIPTDWGFNMGSKATSRATNAR
ncbi:hypothetical protein BGZ63DRAFT_241182 [Mariannaea sp. PMI_226]|nr:hypothetical protein BGZ63DRAFT_241182 [Mariannaea sp. PMI_226]